MARTQPNTVIVWALAFAGVGTLYAAVRNISPLNELRAALSGTGQRTPIDPGPGATGVGLDGDAGGDTGSAGVGILPKGDLVPIGQGSHRLADTAAAGFQRWQELYGAPIIITDSYRDWAQQLAAWESDPERFAHPSKSQHTRGRAVDVNLSAMNADPNNQPATFARLRSTAAAADWRQARWGPGTRNDEPWHFSHGVTG
jgi:hypothetical protein